MKKVIEKVVFRFASMIKENPLSKWLHLESVRAHLGVSMYLAEVLSKLYTGLFSLLFYCLLRIPAEF